MFLDTVTYMELVMDKELGISTCATIIKSFRVAVLALGNSVFCGLAILAHQPHLSNQKFSSSLSKNVVAELRIA